MPARIREETAGWLAWEARPVARQALAEQPASVERQDSLDPAVGGEMRGAVEPEA